MKFRRFEYPSDEINGKSRTELMAECLKLGLPVRKEDTSGTLQLFLELCENENLLLDDYGEQSGKENSFKKFFIKVINGISGLIK